MTAEKRRTAALIAGAALLVYIARALRPPARHEVIPVSEPPLTAWGTSIGGQMGFL